jgi:DNA-binding transcriptional MerR regulator
MDYTVKQLADVAGVSRRTLHYYDEIGLFQPSSVGDNGYRYYDANALLRLQQILFYREMGLPLDDIRRMVDQPDYDVVGSLQAHRKALRQKARRLERLLQTIDNTLRHMKGEIEMSANDMFAGFDEETQKRYEEEARERYGAEDVDASIQRWNSYSDGKKSAIMEEAGEIYQDILRHMDKGPASQEVQAAVARWHNHLRYFYEPTPEVLRGLGQAYEEDPAFAAFYQKIHSDMPAFIHKAIDHYCQNL